MKKFNKSLMTGLVTAGLMASFGANATNGMNAHGYGMKSKGMAGAGVALPQDAMAAANNPAGMVHVGNRLDIGLEAFSPDRESRANGAATYTDQNEEDQFLIPEFGWNKMLNSSSSFGLVMYGNGGMNTSASTTLYDVSGCGTCGAGAGRPTKSNLAQMFIAPTYSKKLNDKHSVGVSLNLAIQEFEANGLGNFSGFKASGQGNDDGLTDQGKDHSFGMGFKFGWLGQLHDKLSVAIQYQTKTDMSKFDSYNQLFANGGEFDIASTWTVGLAWKATPKMNVAFDVHQINYSDIPALANTNCGYLNAHPGSCDLGDPNGPGFGWTDITVYKLGVDYKLNDNFVLRAGYSNGDQPIKETETAFNVIAPAVVEEHITIGATWTMANKDEITAMYMYAPENEVLGVGCVATNCQGRGDLKMSQTSMGVAYGIKF